MLHRPRRGKRRGAAIVEMALVAGVFFLFLFGIFEYCRLLFVMHLTTNAARDGVRFAVVHTNGGTMSGDPTTISAADVISVVNTGLATSGTTVYGSGMCGMTGNIQNYTVNVFYVDPTALAQSPAVVQALSGTIWSDAPFGQFIAVQITGNYQPVVPSLLYMSASVPFTITVMDISEAN